MSGEGLRYNEGKIKYHLMEPHALKGLAEVLTMGAEKYGEYNWQKGMVWSNIYASAERHLKKIMAGEDYDEESGLLHADHLQANAHFMSAYYKIYPQGDDRHHKYLNMPKIGLDIDDVICDFVPAFIKKFNTPMPTSWFWSYNASDHFKYLAEHVEEANEFYLNIPAKINPLEMPFEPHCYITSRSIPSEEITKQWIEIHGFPCRPVYTIPFGASKVDIAKESGIEIFVDDRYENFVELNNAGICTYLFDAPHNQRYNVGAKRIYTLKDLV